MELVDHKSNLDVVCTKYPYLYEGIADVKLYKIGDINFIRICLGRRLDFLRDKLSNIIRIKYKPPNEYVSLNFEIPGTPFHPYMRCGCYHGFLEMEVVDPAHTSDGKGIPDYHFPMDGTYIFKLSR